jgi:hypothetical protein
MRWNAKEPWPFWTHDKSCYRATALEPFPTVNIGPLYRTLLRSDAIVRYDDRLGPYATGVGLGLAPLIARTSVSIAHALDVDRRLRIDRARPFYGLLLGAFDGAGPLRTAFLSAIVSFIGTLDIPLVVVFRHLFLSPTSPPVFLSCLVYLYHVLHWWSSDGKLTW